MDAVLMDSSFPLLNNSTGARVSEDGETVIGTYLLLLGWLSWLGNGAVICILCNHHRSLDPHDLLTFNLAVSDAGISIFGYSRGIVELFHGLGKDGFLVTSLWTCKVDGFLILMFGLISIGTLTAISLLRYIKGCQPHHAHKVDKQKVHLALIFIWITAAIWSGFPLLGFGSFTERKYGTCEIDWTQATSSMSYKCYVIGIFVWGFFIPVSIMVFCYVSIIRTVHASHRNSRGGEISRPQLTMERAITRVSFVICTAFLLAWSPYAVISMWSACGYQVPADTNVVATLLAKSASFYNPIIYLGLSPRFRQEFHTLLCCCCPKKRGKSLNCDQSIAGCESNTKQWVDPQYLQTDEKNLQTNRSLEVGVEMSNQGAPSTEDVILNEKSLEESTKVNNVRI
ncbi:opsin-5-like [Pelobates fuscus]|uniref:opsin-5-like n=1 Tax=Pelobates fuscus TaxID=191477 RepID=UPI002FE4715A